MKDWLIRPITFFAALCIGFGSAWEFWPETPAVETDLDSTTLVIAADEITPPEPEQEIIEEIEPDYDREFTTRLLVTGIFHGDEVKAKNGEKWLGVFEHEGKIELRETRVKIKRVYDDILDYPNKKGRSGKSVAVSDPRTPLFLVKNAKFPVGDVPTTFVGNTWDDAFTPEFSELPPEEVVTSLEEGHVQRFELRGVRYEVKVIRARNAESKEILALIIETGENRQILHTLPVGNNNSVGTLYWIGDIDGDGKPDLYLDLFVHYNVGNRVLFVSGEAEQGRLLKKVANFWTTGC